MCLYNKIFKNQRSDDIRDNFNNGGHRVPSNVQNHGTHIRDDAFISGLLFQLVPIQTEVSFPSRHKLEASVSHLLCIFQNKL